MCFLSCAVGNLSPVRAARVSNTSNSSCGTRAHPGSGGRHLQRHCTCLLRRGASHLVRRHVSATLQHLLLAEPRAHPRPAGATCNGTACFLLCAVGTHPCGGTCVSNTSTLLLRNLVHTPSGGRHLQRQSHISELPRAPTSCGGSTCQSNTSTSSPRNPRAHPVRRAPPQRHRMLLELCRGTHPCAAHVLSKQHQHPPGEPRAHPVPAGATPQRHFRMPLTG